MFKFVINEKLDIELLNVNRNLLIEGWFRDEKEQYHRENICFDSKEEAKIYLKNFLNKKIGRLDKLIIKYKKIYIELEG